MEKKILDFEEFIKETSLNEGLIQTYPIDKVIKYIQKKFNLKNKDISIVRDDGEYIIVDKHITKGSELYNNIEYDLNCGGYYFSDFDDGVYWFEPKFTKDIFDELKESGEIKYLYHITPSINDRKIQSKGLIPKSKNYRYNFPDRIYFVTDKDVLNKEDFLQNMCGILYDSTKIGLMRKFLSKPFDRIKYSQKIKLGEYSVYRIDFNKLENIKLYVDPNARGFDSYFTTDNISPSLLEKIKEIKF